MTIRGTMARTTILALLLFAAAVVTTAVGAEVQSEVAAGGLSFAANPSIRLDSQDVLITPDRITVIYAVRNEAETAQSIYISFVLPDLEANAVQDGEVGLAAADPMNYVQYATTIDGQPAALRAEQRALALGLDVTGQLGAAGVPLFPLVDALPPALDKLSAERRLDFLERGILKDDGAVVVPAWSLKTTAYWRQSIRPGQTIVIQHSYRPIAGVMPAQLDAAKPIRARACMTPAHDAALAKLSAGGRNQPAIIVVTYGVTASADALGPARRFRLIVETGDPATIVSSCRQGLKQTGPMQLDWSTTDYTLDEDLVFAFAR